MRSPRRVTPEEAALAPATQAGMLELGRRCDAAEPESLILLTPHGIHVDGRFAVVVAGRMAGALDETPNVSLDVPVDRGLASATLAALRDAEIPAVGVSFGGKRSRGRGHAHGLGHADSAVVSRGPSRAATIGRSGCSRAGQAAGRAHRRGRRDRGRGTIGPESASDWSPARIRRTPIAPTDRTASALVPPSSTTESWRRCGRAA